MAASGTRCVRRLAIHTSAREPDIRVCVHKELHVEHFPDHLRVKDQNSLKEDNICGVNRDPLFLPGKYTQEFRFSGSKKRKEALEKDGIPPTWNE